MRKYDKEFFSIIFHFIIYKEPSTHDRKLYLSVYSLLLYHFALHRLIYMCYCRGPTTTARSCTKTLPLIMYGMYTALTKLNSSVCFLSHRIAIAIVHSITIPSSKPPLPFIMFAKFARASIQAPKRTRSFATPRRTPPPSAEAMKKNWFTDPGTYPIMIVCAIAISVSTYKIIHDIRSPEAHFSKSERTTLDYIENERTEASAENWTSHRTLHQQKA